MEGVSNCSHDPMIPDTSASSANQGRVSVDKQQKSGSAGKKTHHHLAGGEVSAIGHSKSVQGNKPSAQKQWVRVSQPTQAAQNSDSSATEEVGALVKQGSRECVEPLLALSSSSPSSSLEMRPIQNGKKIKKLEECDLGISSSSTETLKHPRVTTFLCEDPLPKEHDISVDPSQGAEEQPLPSESPATEDDSTDGPQRSLSRTSSLSATAKEFVPKGGSASSAGPTTSPAMHTQPVVPSLNLPHTAPAVLSTFPPMSPLSTTQFGGFPVPMAGPPPPPIPASPMGAMPILGAPHPGLLNMQIPGPPPPPPVIPSPAYILHQPCSSISSLPQPVTLPDHLANQHAKSNLEVAETDYTTQDPAVARAQVAAAKMLLTEELKAKIVKQVEFYFSDVNLPTDHHLMKFVKKDPEGFVPISIVANFRKVKSLMKNHALVGAALQSSNQLVVSEDGKKVRRLHPLPHVDFEEIQSRTIVAENLPADHSIESMERLFGTIGNVKLVRICEPEASNGANQTSAKFAKAGMIVSNKLHALVEYETVEQAERAVLELTDEQSWRSGLHVRLLLRRTNKHSVPKSHKGNEAGSDGGGAEDAMASATNITTEKTGEDGPVLERPEDGLGNDNAHSDGSSKRGRGKGHGHGRGRARGRGQYHPNGGRGHPFGTPPQAGGLANIEAKPPVGPRMPDGTRGFTLGRGKAMATNCA